MKALEVRLEKLAAAERKFAQTMIPIEALRAWLLLLLLSSIAFWHDRLPAILPGVIL